MSERSLPENAASATQNINAAIRSRRAVSAVPARKTADISYKVKRNLGLTLEYLFLIAMTVFAIFPLYYVLQASFNATQQLITTTLQLFPQSPTLGDYTYILGQTSFLHWLLNTTMLVGGSTLFGLIISVLGAYALSRFKFKGRLSTLTFLLTLQAFPGLLAITAYYQILQSLHLTGTLEGLMLIYTAGSIIFGAWNIKGYFDTLPKELEEAAYVDGASTFRTFWQIMLPLASPSIAATALISFIGGFNEFALANLVLTPNAAQSNITITVGLYSLANDHSTPWGYFAAASVLVTVPLVIIFLLLQRYLQSGLTIGSVKG